MYTTKPIDIVITLLFILYYTSIIVRRWIIWRTFFSAGVREGWRRAAAAEAAAAARGLAAASGRWRRRADGGGDAAALLLCC